METSLTVNDPVKSLVKNNPRCAEVFEELNIDFYCGGDTSLLSACEETACEEKDLEPHRVYLRLMELPSASSTREKDVFRFDPG